MVGMMPRTLPSPMANWMMPPACRLANARLHQGARAPELMQAARSGSPRHAVYAPPIVPAAKNDELTPQYALKFKSVRVWYSPIIAVLDVPSGTDPNFSGPTKPAPPGPVQWIRP